MTYPNFPIKHAGGQGTGQYCDVPFDPSYFEPAIEALIADAVAAMLVFAQETMQGSLCTPGGGQVAVRPPFAVPQVVGPRFTWLMQHPGGRAI